MLHVGSGRQRELSWAPPPEGRTPHPVPFVLSQVAARCVSPHTFLPRWVVGFFSAGTGPEILLNLVVCLFVHWLHTSLREGLCMALRLQMRV